MEQRIWKAGEVEEPEVVVPEIRSPFTEEQNTALADHLNNMGEVDNLSKYTSKC